VAILQRAERRGRKLSHGKIRRERPQPVDFLLCRRSVGIVFSAAVAGWKKISTGAPA
jgi:hypothetical protein